MQTSYSLNQGTAFAGMLADGSDNLIESGSAKRGINFGNAVGAEAGDETNVHMPVRDKGTLTYNGDFQAGDEVVITINGVVCSTVTYAVSHAATAAAVLAAIQAHSAVSAASKSANGRIFTIETEADVISIATTGSSVTATPAVDYVAPQDDLFRGVAVHRNKENGAQYVAGDIVDVLRKGRIYVNVSEAVVADDDAYVDLAGGLGKFCKTSTNNLATGGKFRKASDANNIAVLEINLP